MLRGRRPGFTHRRGREVKAAWLIAVDLFLAATLLVCLIVAFPVIICVGAALFLYDGITGHRDA
jgi:hypothetical protein